MSTSVWILKPANGEIYAVVRCSGRQATSN
jgi:hypothetical protein